MIHLYSSIHPEISLPTALLGSAAIKRAIKADLIPLSHPYYRHLSSDGCGDIPNKTKALDRFLNTLDLAKEPYELKESTSCTKDNNKNKHGLVKVIREIPHKLKKINVNFLLTKHMNIKLILEY